MNWESLISDNPFYEFTLILALAALLGAIGQLLKQPLIVMFIFLGILAGPSVLDLVKSKDNFNLLAEVGISILLFIVGLKLDIRIIKSVGKIALMTGLGQVLFTTIFGYFIGLALGFSSMHSFYIAVALTFSSTIIIVKLLSDKKEIDSLHGQIAIGFLLVQDILVILVMIVISALGNSGNASPAEDLFKTLVSGAGMLVFALIAMKWIIPAISPFLARSKELLTLFAIAWAVSLASVGEITGFSGAVGAFLAGICLASSDFKDVISSRLTSLRDFLLLFFFVNLGADINISDLGNQVFPALIFSAFVLIGNPVIVLIIMGIMGYRKRTSFLAGLTVAQISEFSLIFAALGLAVGHITEEVVGLITLVGLITIALSTYLIIYSHQIYEFLSPALGIFQRNIPFRENEIKTIKIKKYELIILGMGRFGTRLSEMLDEHPEIHYLGIDFDPSVIKRFHLKEKDIVYGDIEDPEILDHIPYQDTKLIISTVPDYRLSKQLIKALKKENYLGKIYLTALNDLEYQRLSFTGAEEVLRPHQMAATNFYNSYIKEIII